MDLPAQEILLRFKTFNRGLNPKIMKCGMPIPIQGYDLFEILTVLCGDPADFRSRSPHFLPLIIVKLC